MLPFLKSRKVPKLRTMSGESKYGFDEDDEMSEQAISELMEAIHSKDHMKLASALKAVIDCIMAKESESNGIDEKA